MLKVTCAIIVKKGKVLAACRSSKMDLPGKWEFPGGKIQENESEEECLKREIKEELGLGLMIKEKLESHIHHYPSKSIELIPFVAEIISGKLRPTEHEKVDFFGSKELKTLDWAEADIPILHSFLNKYQSQLKS